MVMKLTIMIIIVMMVMITMQRPHRPPPENRLLYTQSVQLDITPQYAYLGRNVRNQIPTNFSVASSPFKLENVPP